MSDPSAVRVLSRRSAGVDLRMMTSLPTLETSRQDLLPGSTLQPARFAKYGR